MKKLLALLLIVFSCQFTFAADDGDFLLQRQITIGDGKNAYGKKVFGSASRSVMENVPIKDSTKEEVRQLIKRSIAADKPTQTKVGSSMLKRIYSPQAIVGTAAVTGLLAAIGWVMEDGVYVKYKEPDPSKCEENPSACGVYVWSRDPQLGTYSSQQGICQAVVKYHGQTLTGIGTRNGSYACFARKSNGDSDWWAVDKKFNPNPSTEPPKGQKVPLTAATLGAIMLGAAYSDPAGDKSAESTINDGDYTSVKETYEKDPSGVGNELADAMDDKLKNAKPTDDGKSSYIGDPKYDDVPLSDDRDDSSDRGWDEKGDEATGGTEPEKDPETGESTGNQSITLKFPLFCSWASKMCLWYDDWKASDKVYKDHMKKTEEHQGAEKTFWGSVKGWFDWTKEEKELENEELEIEEKEIISYVRENHVQFGQTCPFTPQMQSLPMGILGSMDFETDLTFICDFGHQANPYVLGLGHLAALIFLLIGLRNGNA